VGDLAELAESVDYRELVNMENLVVDDAAEPLRRQAEAFRQTVVNGVPPVVSASDGLAAVRVADDIVKAIKNYRWDGKASGRKGLDVIRRDE
jgi:predicted dehydrogenase